MHKILLVDDEPAFCELCALWLTQAGYEVESCGDAETAQALFGSHSFDLVLLDMALPPSFLPEDTLSLISGFAEVPVIVLTGHAERELALNSIAAGAWDFLAKPVDPEMLAVVVKRALIKSGLDKDVRDLRARLPETEAPDLGMVGNSESTRSIRELIERIAPTDVSVLIYGPSGTGKEVIAEALHKNGLRRDNPFVSVHCGAIPAELLESELFGYKKGAFTGADKDRIGLLQSADKGTLFLDEIGEMPMAMQVKLLRVLQEGTFYPVGGREQVSIDVRLVSATNRHLPGAVNEGLFREDLYYRIKGITLNTQELAKRPEDIPVLVRYFLNQYGQRVGREFRIAEDAMSWFVAQPWPGNVRELKNTLESLAAITVSDVIRLQDIAFLNGETETAEASSEGTTLEAQVRGLEIRLIRQALAETEDNRTRAAELLGLSRQGLLKKMDRYGIR